MKKRKKRLLKQKIIKILNNLFCLIGFHDPIKAIMIINSGHTKSVIACKRCRKIIKGFHWRDLL